jgi:hypothetical protein
MPSKPSRNVVGKYLEFSPALVTDVDAFARSRGQTFRAVVMDACRRHLKHPPPPPPPVPDPADTPFPTDQPKRRTTSRKKGGAL